MSLPLYIRTSHYKDLAKEGKSQVASDSSILASRCLLHFPHLPLITGTSESHYSNPRYPSWVPHGRLENFIFSTDQLSLQTAHSVPVFPAEARSQAFFLVNTCCLGDTPVLFELVLFSFHHFAAEHTICVALLTTFKPVWYSLDLHKSLTSWK